MESTVTRPAVDLEPRRSQQGIAFILALLSVPGSTIAWELPAGGLWIGLPLAAAAIYFGLKARREAVGGTGLATAAVVIAGLMIAQMAVWFIAAAVS